jgi:class 3 adenylate cyclase
MSTTTVLYTDIARSSTLLADVGADAYATLFTDHVATIRRAVEAERGEVTKLLGDGVDEDGDDVVEGAADVLRVLLACEHVPNLERLAVGHDGHGERGSVIGVEA